MSGSIGDNVFRASGVIAAAAGGAIEWDTSIHTSTVTAESGKGYFVNTSGGAITVNLPAASAGDIVAIKDYAGTFDSNACTLAPNGSENIGGGTSTDPTLTVEGESITLVYADATQGWLATQQGVTASPSGAETFVTATGGNAILSVGDFKTHVFTGPGTFTVCSVSSETPANNVVDYMVSAGGGGGGSRGSAGGGAGGFRLSNSTGCLPAPTMSPLIAPAALPVSATGYPVTVGGGGAASPVPGSGNGVSGSNAVFSTITSTGGGGGRGPAGMGAGIAGGSGGGGKGGPTSTSGYPGGAGNTPPVSPSQGNAGGAGFDGVALSTNAGGGGGAGAVGANSSHNCGGAGGIGSFLSDTYFGPTAPSYGEGGPVSSTRYFTGGGGGACPDKDNVGAGGAGGGGPGNGIPGGTGTVNTGGGGGGATNCGCPCAPTQAGAGGSGVVTIRYKYQ